MPHRHAVAIDGIGVGAGAAGREVRGDLVAVEIKIDPAAGFPAHAAAEQARVESARRLEVVHREREMESRPHHPSSQSRGLRKSRYSAASGVPSAGRQS
jgi:hypothetical protein